MPNMIKQELILHCHLAIFCFLEIALLLLNSTVTQAASYYWSASSDDWLTATNWGGTVPNNSDCAYIQNGGTVTITQTGAQCSCLNLGATKTGTVKMTGGDLSVWNSSYVGNSGTGTFTQSDGTNTISSSLFLGFSSGSNGEYTLSGTGQLSAYDEHIGESGSGIFTHAGGTNSPSYVFLGVNSGSHGTYNLSDTGNLSAYELIGYSGTGTFMQNGGTNTSSNLSLGVNSGASGIYNLSSDGQLSGVNEFIGYNGAGTFTQTSGTNTISSCLSLGHNSGSNGAYYLNGGTLVLKSLDKGSGAAAFNFGGGTLQASSTFTTTLPMTLTGDGGDANIDTAGYTVTLSGVLSGSGGLNKLGSGTLAISNTATYGRNTTITGGTLIFSGGIASGGSTIINVESGTAILKTTNVSRSDLDIYTAASATFEVADGTHVVGDITGSGATQVDSGASLTVTSICQDTLIMGRGATIAIQAIPGGLQTSHDNLKPVPEPSTIDLLTSGMLLLGWLTMRCWRQRTI
jgi:autotransporter-associated beta strand protein